MTSPAQSIPEDIESSEVLARGCERRLAGPPVRWQAFAASKEPFDISVDRTEYVNPWDRISGQKRKTLVALLAGKIREEIEYVKVVSAPPPPAHAQIEIRNDLAFVPPVSKEELNADIELMKLHSKICSQLAQIASPMTEPEGFRK